MFSNSLVRETIGSVTYSLVRIENKTHAYYEAAIIPNGGDVKIIGRWNDEQAARNWFSDKLFSERIFHGQNVEYQMWVAREKRRGTYKPVDWSKHRP